MWSVPCTVQVLQGYTINYQTAEYFFVQIVRVCMMSSGVREPRRSADWMTDVQVSAVEVK